MKLAALLAAALLSACNLSNDDGFQPTATAGQPPATMATDAFVGYVSQVVANRDETAQPASINGVVVTAPEDTAAQPLTGA